jgi:preprotein translocase SecE subunit
MKFASDLLNYFGGVKKEFKHIRFLSRKEVYQISLTVIICVVIFGVIFSIFDLIVSSLIRFIVGF